VAYVVRAWGSDVIRGLGRVVFAFFRVEVKGRENLDAAGDRVVIAPNHGSHLDGPLLQRDGDRTGVGDEHADRQQAGYGGGAPIAR
jgi:1-acyl-sn-glycerol-3-phosphate acyltransferase